jgi:hypothetical protein
VAHGIRDTEIMEKFCTPNVSKPVTLQVQVPPLITKLVEVEYMLAGLDVPPNADKILYK